MHRVVIIGAGFAGFGRAVRRRRRTAIRDVLRHHRNARVVLGEVVDDRDLGTMAMIARLRAVVSVAFLGRGRRQRTITEQQLFAHTRSLEVERPELTQASGTA